MPHSLIPSPRVPNALAALRLMLPRATWLHGAVAFATQGGVALLEDLVSEVGRPETLRIVVRGAPVTKPQAVLALDSLGADVRVVMGKAAARFHPKLWVARTSTETWVLSGSGNLTQGGLRDNDEQFELLRLEQSPPSLGGPQAGLNREASQHLARWRAFFDQGIPLGAARGTAAWALWAAQQERRAEIAAELADLDDALGTASATAPGGEARSVDSELALSASTERPTIERWMRRWYPDEELRATVWGLLGEVMRSAHAHRPSGWAACAVHWSNHDGRPRLEVLCGGSQVFVAHSARGVFFEGPPEHLDAAGHGATLRAAEVGGGSVERWGEGDNHHPLAIVPSTQAAESAAHGGREAVEAAIRWRSPKAEAGKASHARFHSPALVEAVRRATGVEISQPDYVTWR